MAPRRPSAKHSHQEPVHRDRSILRYVMAQAIDASADGGTPTAAQLAATEACRAAAALPAPTMEEERKCVAPVAQPMGEESLGGESQEHALSQQPACVAERSVRSSMFTPATGRSWAELLDEGASVAMTLSFALPSASQDDPDSPDTKSGGGQNIARPAEVGASRLLSRCLIRGFVS